MAEWHSRYLEKAVREDIEQKMVFIGGPRQVGKTTLARIISTHFRSPSYLNWDSRTHRHLILKEQWPPDTDLMIFDELHKYPKWKQWIKGVWDTRRHDERIIITGSSRMDIFRRGGDSLLGRYHYHRLHPFSLREISGMKAEDISLTKHVPELQFDNSLAMDELEMLWRFGGFPEPLLSGSERTLKRWQKERFERVFHEDIRDTEAVRSLAQVELMAGMLPERVGSPLSMNSLVEDIEASPKTIKTWLELLCRNYYIFRVPPYHRRLDRALKKESKYYLWDWSEVKDDGARFENMVASHLLKWCHYYHDRYGMDAQLYYVRDVEKREVDFLVVWEKQPWMLVECKVSAVRDITNLKYFANKMGIRQMYLVVMRGGLDYEDKRTGIRVIPAVKFLGALL